MAFSVVLNNPSFISLDSSKCYKNQAPTLTQSQFLASKSFLKLKKQSLRSSIHVSNPSQKSRSAPVVFAVQSNFLKGNHGGSCLFLPHNQFALQTVLKVGKDGIEAGTNLVPDSVPRPIARISVSVALLGVSLFVLKSFLSTAVFALATMGLVYFAFIAMNKNDGPRGGGGTPSTEDSLEEARRIMEKYK